MGLSEEYERNSTRRQRLSGVSFWEEAHFGGASFWRSFISEELNLGGAIARRRNIWEEKRKVFQNIAIEENRAMRFGSRFA